MANFVLVTDRGGHLHNALKLVEQMEVSPDAVVTTHGPDIDTLKKETGDIFSVPYLFTWFGKLRVFNPFNFCWHVIVALVLALKLRPRVVVSLGASNVVFFCYWARLLGATIVHVDCMNQVRTRSVTGRLLYPICETLYVQWAGLLKAYGPKARYEGWVL